MVTVVKVKVVQIIRQKPNLETQRNWGEEFFVHQYSIISGRPKQTRGTIRESRSVHKDDRESRAGLDTVTEVGGLTGQGAVWGNLGN